LINVWEVKTVKSTHRRAASAAGFLALSFAAAPLMGQGQQPQQRGGPPNNDTPYILITTFHSSDRQLGVDMGDELRKRVQQEHSAKELFVIQKNSINGTLEASGYRPDSALSASDLMELAKQLRGEEVLEGSIKKAGTGDAVVVDTRVLMRAGPTATVAQPLPRVNGKDVGDAAKQLEREITEVNKSINSYKTCRNSLLAAKYPEAMAAARAGIAGYPNTTLNRLCLLSAFTLTKAPADSIIAIATAIRSMDSTSMIALSNLVDAYKAKGDTAKAIQASLAIYRLDPTNSQVGRDIVNILANSGAPEQAIPIIDTLLVNNPGDPEMLKTKWLLQLRAKQFKAALVSGEELVKADTAAANLDYFQRQIGAAQSDSNAAAVQQFAAKAMQKFPTDMTFPALLSQSYIKSGQYQQALVVARKATTADPKNTNAWLLAIAAANGAGMRDSSSAFAKMAIDAGADKATFAAALLGPTQELLAKAQASKARADWQAVLESAQAVDAMASSPSSKFFVGVSSFQVAADLVQQLQDEAKTAQKTQKKADKEAACTTSKQIEDLLTTTQMAMPAGAAMSADAKATAGQIMGGATQITDFVTQIKKAFSCK
jgi:tetratricopeptide (TPR) repeat protein